MASKKVVTPAIKETFACLSCGKKKKSEEYYSSESSLYKKNVLDNTCKTPFCKECIYKKYEEILENKKSTGKAIHTICALMDIPFKKQAFDMAEKTTGSNIVGIYIRNINSRKEFRGLNFLDSDNVSDTFNDDERLVVFRRDWGEGFTYEEYLNLDYRYSKIIEEKGTVDFASADSIRKFVIAGVIYDRDIISSNATDRNSAASNYQKALTGSGLNKKEVVESNLSAGELILNWEKHSPVLNLEEHFDVDKFTDVKDSIIKHINKLFGRS